MGIFDDDQDDSPLDPAKNYYDEFVGEGKKYKDNEAAGRALAEKDAFIEKLKGETSGLRQELKTRLSLEEAVTRISSSKLPITEPEPKAPEPNIALSASFDPASVGELIDKTLTDREANARRTRNAGVVEEKLQEAFGPTYKRTVKEQAQKLGLGEAFLKDLAAEQPQAFLKLFDVVPTHSNPAASTAPRSGINTESFSRISDGTRRQSHFNEIRKKDPGRYWSVSVQNEIHKEALRQGESFFDS